MTWEQQELSIEAKQEIALEWFTVDGFLLRKMGKI